MIVLAAAAWLAIAVLGYVFLGYWLLLGVLALFATRTHGGRPPEEEGSAPLLTVLLTVYNEQAAVADRIRNILSCRYPENRLEVLVASDGSTDGTDEEVGTFDEPRVRLFRPESRQGKTDTQNRAVETAKGEILLFTDADTRFDAGFLEAIVRPFSDPAVGGADGHLLFAREQGDLVAESQGIYWAQELSIRARESRLGCLAVATGACLALRRALFRPMSASVGEDCLIPLDVVRQGYRMVHVSGALAFDRMPSTPADELRTRARMTLRNWQGTWMYADLLNPLRHPRVAFALWSHKILRWLSPLFLILWVAAGVASIGSPGFWGLPGWSALLLVAAVALGGACEMCHVRLPVVGIAYSFGLANLGFLIGVGRALLGRKISQYR
ncbi:glycosyltransferase [Planctomycetota bacterium]